MYIGERVKRTLNIFLLFFICAPINAQTIDHTAVAARAQRMQQAQLNKQQQYDAAIKLGVTALCGCALYYCYSVYAQDKNVVQLTVPEKLVHEFKESPAVIKAALELYVAQKNAWSNSLLGSAIKFTGTIIAQSMVFQTLQPAYKKIQNYFSSKESVAISRSWFLTEQCQDASDTHKVIDVPRELSDFIMHSTALEYAYTHAHEDLIHEAAHALLSHLLFVREHEVQYMYQKRIIQQCYDELTDIIQTMLTDAHQQKFDQSLLDAYKDKLRTLRDVPYYAIV